MSHRETTGDCQNDLMLSFWEERCRLNRAVFDWCLRNAERCMSEGTVEKSLQWAHITGLMAFTFPFECLASPELENHLLRIARELPVPRHNDAHRDGAQKRWLHVFTEVYPTGGHTANVRRWIELDANAHRHSVALLNQRKEVPTALRELVCRTGGKVLWMDRNAPMLSRAMQLREACMEADVVVLHLHPWDVLPAVALGVYCGPPVLLMNIADHVFWIGGSVADVVLNLRESYGDWIARHRGVRRINHLPIPLPTPDSRKKAGAQCSELRASMRKALELPLDAPVMLTSGLGFKYIALPGLNFFDAARAILMSCPEAYLVAIGPSEVGDWKALRQVTGDRVRAVGPQTDVSVYYAIADIYLEGFPIGSNAAFLEAAIEAIPCVPAPRMCPPLFGSDGVAPRQLERPADVAAYVRRAIELITDKDERRRCGEFLATAIRERHTGPGWLRYLRHVEAELPPSHSVYPLPLPEPVPQRFADLYTQYSTEWHHKRDPLDEAYRSAIALGLKPKLDTFLKKAVRSAKHVRGNNAAHELVIALLDPMLSRLPTKPSGLLYQKVVGHLCHDGRIMGMCRRVVEAFRGRARPSGSIQ